MSAGFRKSIATVSLSGTLPEKLRAAASIGFDGVEIFEHDLLNFPGTPGDIRDLCAELGLEISLFQPFRDFEGMPEPLRSRGLERARRKLDLMLELGAPQVLVCSNVQPTAIDDPQQAAADLRAMAELAHERGLLVGYEALAWGTHVNRWRQAWTIVQQADHPALGLILDSFRTLAVGDTIDDLAETVPAEKLFFVQLADSPFKHMDVLSWSRHYRNFPGQGDLDVSGFTRQLVRAGYRGPLSLEIFNDEFRAASAYLTANDGLRSLLWVEAQAGAITLPAPPEFRGFEFLEFAVDSGDAPELTAALARLGFAHTGRHRSKAVELYQQGQANLIVNAEPDSHAADYHQLYGPSVCAVALRVDDVARTLERASALLCSEWIGPAGDHEYPLPALRAPDGMLFYLVDDALAAELYRNDFELTVQAPGAGAGLDQIDHIAQALPPERLGSFILFYRTVFGLKVEGLHEIPDPYGLVNSRAMSSAGGEVRFALNSSESERTATGRFVGTRLGSGVHHIALASSDLPRTVRALRAAGAELLEIPENYYEDLDLRFVLDESALTTMQNLGLLYDQDSAGEFWQAYTAPFRGRFFFELLQRQGYQGYGASNASVRMNAMTADLERH